MSFGSFIEPLNIFGFPGFQGQITFGQGLYGYPSGLEYGWKPPRWIADLSLGGGIFSGDIAQLPGLGLPALVPENAVLEPTVPFPLPVDFRDEPSDQIELPSELGSVMEKFYASPGSMTAEQVAELARLGYEVVWGEKVASIETAYLLDPPLQPEDDDVGWITDNPFYSAADVALGGWLPGGAVAPVVLGGTGQLPVITQPQYPGGANFPAAPLPPGPPPIGGVLMPSCDDDPMKGMVWKKVCGQYRWVKQKRRRRNALVTKTDLRGLAALKGVLGQGKAFEVWIATHA